MPVVFMQLLDYGSMSGRLTGSAYTSQHELLFMVVLEWFEECSTGGFQFNGKCYKRHAESHALVTPFIFVDNPLSVMMGRENFGWPKSLINLRPVAPGWAPEAGESVPIMRIGAMRLAQFYEGQSQRFSTILEIEKRAGYSDGTVGVSMDPARAISDWWSGSLKKFRYVIAAVAGHVGLEWCWHWNVDTNAGPVQANVGWKCDRAWVSSALVCIIGQLDRRQALY